MKTPRNIRKDLIKPNMEELLGFGDLGETTPNAGKVGRPSKVYYLNEEQALLICLLSRTAKALAVRKEVIEVYMAYRRGHLELTEAGR